MIGEDVSVAIPDTLPSTRTRISRPPAADVRGEAATPGRRSRQAQRRSGWRQLGYRLGTFAAGSVAATVVSQLTLTGMYWLFGASATMAAAVAFTAGAIPNFIVSWRWTWRRKGRPELVRELMPYVLVSIGSLIVTSALTTWGDKLVSPLMAGKGEQTIALAVVYFGSNGLLFLVKFVLLDRVLSTSRKAVDAPRVPVEAG
jgi:putative flippase GtrA